MPRKRILPLFPDRRRKGEKRTTRKLSSDDKKTRSLQARDCQFCVVQEVIYLSLAYLYYVMYDLLLSWKGEKNTRIILCSPHKYTNSLRARNFQFCVVEEVIYFSLFSYL